MGEGTFICVWEGVSFTFMYVCVIYGCQKRASDPLVLGLELRASGRAAISVLNH